MRVNGISSSLAALALTAAIFSSRAAIPVLDRPITLAGHIEAAEDPAFRQLLEPVDFRLPSWLEWPTRHLDLLPAEGIIVAEVVEIDPVTGRVRLVVAGRSPHFWAEPSIRDHWQKGPGAYSGFGMEHGKFKDFASVPHTDRRAYSDDNGLRGRNVQIASGTVELPTPVRVDPPRLVRRVLKLRWVAPATGAYRVWKLDRLGGRPALAQQVSGRAGEALELDLPVEALQSFYYVQTLDR